MSNESSGGIGFVGLLTIVFITLKLTNVIDWYWFWVLSPIIISFMIDEANIMIKTTSRKKLTEIIRKLKLKEKLTEEEMKIYESL